MDRRAAGFSVALLAAVGLWLASGPGLVSRENLVRDLRTEPRRAEPPAMRVRVAGSVAVDHQTRILVRGFTRASRVVSVRSEVNGRVVALAGERGGAVAADEVLVRLDVGERAAELREAQAAVERYRLEHEAANRLNAEGYGADANLAAALAALESARARAERVRAEIAKTSIGAPFGGVLDRRPVERGDYVMQGQVVAVIADLDPLVVEGRISERERARVEAGQAGTTRLLDGSQRSGRVRYVSSVADPETRTFAVELELENPDRSLVDGLTAEVTIPSRVVKAHLVPASVLTLAEDGSLGVKVLDDDDLVRFLPVHLLGQSRDGLWVDGLPERCRIIIVGGEFVATGTPAVAEDVGPLLPAVSRGGAQASG